MHFMQKIHLLDALYVNNHILWMHILMKSTFFVPTFGFDLFFWFTFCWLKWKYRGIIAFNFVL